VFASLNNNNRSNLFRMNPRFLLSLLLLLGIFMMPVVSAQESLVGWGDELYHDGQTVLSAPLHWQAPQWQRAAGLVVITGTLMATTDQNVADYYDRHRHTQINNVMQGVGDVLSPPALLGYSAALWGAGQLLPNDELSGTGFKMGEAVVFSSVIAGGIKVMVGRARPFTGADANDFSGWSWQDDHQSFPSAHATAAFAAARVLSPQLTPMQRLGAYGVASLVAYSRVYQSEHWLSDVVFGAGLGYSVGALLADDTGNDNKEQAEWWVIPSASGITLAWLQTW
jgi:membrane-associated phospholipid phosphatase